MQFLEELLFYASIIPHSDRKGKTAACVFVHLLPDRPVRKADPARIESGFAQNMFLCGLSCTGCMQDWKMYSTKLTASISVGEKSEMIAVSPFQCVTLTPK